MLPILLSTNEMFTLVQEYNVPIYLYSLDTYINNSTHFALNQISHKPLGQQDRATNQSIAGRILGKHNDKFLFRTQVQFVICNRHTLPLQGWNCIQFQVKLAPNGNRIRVTIFGVERMGGLANLVSVARLINDMGSSHTCYSITDVPDRWGRRAGMSMAVSFVRMFGEIFVFIFFLSVGDIFVSRGSFWWMFLEELCI